jgi:dipeptidase E
MSKRLLLISNSTNVGEPYLEYTRPHIQSFLGKEVRKVLFVPYAGVSVTYDDYTQKVATVFKELGYDLSSTHQADDPHKAVREAEAIIVGGGNTFHLFHVLHETGLMHSIREAVLNGTPFVGWSAGSNVACPSLKTTNDMPIIMPPSFDGMNLISFQINPHYTDMQVPNHGGETREQRIREFLVINPDMVIVGLKEGTMLRLDGDKISYIGQKTIKVFRKDEPTLEFDKNANLDFLL